MVLHKLLGLPEREKHVVSLCGGGGKTTLMYALARETKASLPTALFTTTHIYPPTDEDIVLSVPFSETVCRMAWESGQIAGAGVYLTAEGKFRAPEEDAMRFLCTEAAAVFIESDGARRLPIKYPAAWEPVVREETTHTIVVAGLSALGQRPEDVVHRYALARDVIDLSGTVLTERQAAVLLWEGYRRFDPIFLINQADTPELAECGERICEMLRALGAHRAVAASLHALVGKRDRSGVIQEAR